MKSAVPAFCPNAIGLDHDTVVDEAIGYACVRTCVRERCVCVTLVQTLTTKWQYFLLSPVIDGVYRDVHSSVQSNSINL